MSLFVVDASVVIKWFVPEVQSLKACRLLERPDDYAAPDLLFVEIGNILWKKIRRGELSEATAQEILTDLESFTIREVPCKELMAQAHTLAVATGRSVYDAMYVALAIRFETQVITADQKLANAASADPRLAPYVRSLTSAATTS